MSSHRPGAPVRALARAALILLAPAALLAQPPDCVPYDDLPAVGAACALAYDDAVSHAAPYPPGHVLVHQAGQLEVYAVDGPAPQRVGLLTGLGNCYREQPAVVGPYVFLAQDPGVVVDLTDPTAPVVAAELDQDYNGFAVHGSLLAAAGYLETHLLDVTDPLAPVHLGTIDRSGRLAFLGEDLAILGTGIWTYDLADPAAPALIGALEYETHSSGSGPYSYYSATRVLDARQRGDQLILLTNFYQQYGSWVYGNVEITNTVRRRRLDVSDPLAPVEVAVAGSHVTHDVHPMLDYALADLGDLMIAGREVFDPSSADLATLTVLPTGVPMPGGVIPREGGVIVCDDNTVSRVALATSPPDPIDNLVPPLDHAGDITGRFRQAGVNDGFLVHVTMEELQPGDAITHVALYAGPSQAAAASFDRYGSPYHLDCAGRRFVLGGLLFDVALDFSIAEHDLGLPWSTSAARFAGPDRLVTVASGPTLGVHDIADPEVPALLGEVPLPAELGHVGDLAVCDGLALMAGQGGLVAARIEDPTALEVGALLPLADPVRWVVALAGGRALALAGGEVLRLDLSDLADPQVLASRVGGAASARPMVQGGIAYTVDEDLLTAYRVDTLQPLGALAFQDDTVGAPLPWQGHLVGAGGSFRGFAYLPAACEAQTVAAPDRPAAAVLLRGAAPNPFNPQTTVRFQLGHAGAVRLGIYDLRGRLVRQLADGRWPAGQHAVHWDGRTGRGRAAAAGVYLLRLEAGGQVRTTKAALVR